MSTGVIKNANLNQTDTKELILQYLYKNTNQKIRFNHITRMDTVDEIRDTDYIICPRYSGVRSWIVIFRNGNNYYFVDFPKHSQFKRDDLVIHPVNTSVISDMYNGTIMEGIFFIRDDKKNLVIDEVYSLCGQSQANKPKHVRLDDLSHFLCNNLNASPDISISVTKYFRINSDSLRDLFELIKSDEDIREIIFYPNRSGKKIYNYTIVETDRKDHYIEYSIFKMTKTRNTDVYRLYDVNTGEKIGIAHVPDIGTSKTCKKWFADNKVEDLVVRCQLDQYHDRWVPIEMIDS